MTPSSGRSAPERQRTRPRRRQTEEQVADADQQESQDESSIEHLIRRGEARSRNGSETGQADPRHDEPDCPEASETLGLCDAEFGQGGQRDQHGSAEQ